MINQHYSELEHFTSRSTCGHIGQVVAFYASTLRQRHQWLGVVLAPPSQQYRLTRPQRAVILLSAVMASTMTNGLFFGRTAASLIIESRIIRGLRAAIFMLPSQWFFPKCFNACNLLTSATVVQRHKRRKRGAAAQQFLSQDAQEKEIQRAVKQMREDERRLGLDRANRMSMRMGALGLGKSRKSSTDGGLAGLALGSGRDGWGNLAGSGSDQTPAVHAVAHFLRLESVGASRTNNGHDVDSPMMHHQGAGQLLEADLGDDAEPAAAHLGEMTMSEAAEVAAKLTKQGTVRGNVGGRRGGLNVAKPSEAAAAAATLAPAASFKMLGYIASQGKIDTSVAAETAPASTFISRRAGGRRGAAALPVAGALHGLGLDTARTNGDGDRASNGAGAGVGAGAGAGAAAGVAAATARGTQAMDPNAPAKWTRRRRLVPTAVVRKAAEVGRQRAHIDVEDEDQDLKFGTAALYAADEGGGGGGGAGGGNDLVLGGATGFSRRHGGYGLGMLEAEHDDSAAASAHRRGRGGSKARRGQRNGRGYGRGGTSGRPSASKRTTNWDSIDGLGTAFEALQALQEEEAMEDAAAVAASKAKEEEIAAARAAGDVNAGYGAWEYEPTPGDWDDADEADDVEDWQYEDAPKSPKTPQQIAAEQEYAERVENHRAGRRARQKARQQLQAYSERDMERVEVDDEGLAVHRAMPSIRIHDKARRRQGGAANAWQSKQLIAVNSARSVKKHHLRCMRESFAHKAHCGVCTHTSLLTQRRSSRQSSPLRTTRPCSWQPCGSMACSWYVCCL